MHTHTHTHTQTRKKKILKQNTAYFHGNRQFTLQTPTSELLPFPGSSLFVGLNKEEMWSFLNSSIELILTGVQSIFLDLSNLRSNLQQIAQLPFFFYSIELITNTEAFSLFMHFVRSAICFCFIKYPTKLQVIRVST